MLELAKQKGEDPFLILLDNIEDPHNLGAIIRTANLAGAHGVIIPKHRAAGLTAIVAKTSADGKLVLKEFPESLLRRFKREGVDNPLLCSLLDQQLGKDADREVET